MPSPTAFERGIDQPSPAVFLDRDGVINHSLIRDGRPFAPRSRSDFKIIPGVKDAITKLRSAGYRIFVITNQPDVATGKVTQQFVDDTHKYLSAELGIDKIYSCFHVDADACDCRKPRPGMIHTAAREFPVDLTKSFCVGDRWRDVEAGTTAGCQSVFIDYGYGEQRPESWAYACRSLAEAADFILGTPKPTVDGAVEIAATFIVRPDGSALFQLRDTNPRIPHAGLWSLPGGRQLVTESSELCAFRELWEETNIKADELTYLTTKLMVDDKIDVRLNVHLYWTRYDGQDIVCREGRDLKFLSIDELADKSIVKDLLSPWRSVISEISK